MGGKKRIATHPAVPAATTHLSYFRQECVERQPRARPEATDVRASVSGFFSTTTIWLFWISNSSPAQVMRFEPKRSEEHTSELQSRLHLVCRLLLEKKKKN